jgi:uncharacterized repeat protein (TIGR01451 family)
MIASTAVGQPGNAELALTFNNSGFAASTGQYFKCSINVYNAGWEIATNATITNWLPSGLEFVSVTSSRGTCSQSAGIVTCALGDFPPYQSATLTMEFRAVATGSYTNVAIAASATPDPNATNNQASFTTLVTAARFFGVGSTDAHFSNPTLTLMTNNQVLVVGQYGPYLGKVTDLYSVPARTFTTPIGTAVEMHLGGSATLLKNGTVLLAGGLNPTGAKTAEIYNPVTQLFHQVGDMFVYSSGHQATLQPDGTVFLCGGNLTTNELFNPVTETFSLVPGTTCAFNGIYLSTGKFLYFNYGRAYLYDTNTSTSVETSGFQQPRAYHTATLLPNGKVLIAGGYGSWGATTGPISSAELYDPVTDTFTYTANLLGPREYHGACLLPDGTVLIAGGSVSDNDPFSLTNAEVYDPNGTVDVPGIGVGDTSLLEGDTGTNWMQFNVWLTETSSFPVSVKFSTGTGTAGITDWGVANVDFVPTNGTLIIPPGQTNVIIPVGIIGDNVREPNETLTLNIDRPVQAWMARATGVGTILDDDPVPTLSIAPASVNERDTGLTNLAFNVTLTAQSLVAVTVDYSASDQTATAGSDYLPVSGTLTFNPGETNKIINVPVIGDLVPEADETLQVSLVNAQNAGINVAQAIGTIFNDDGIAGRAHHFDISPIGTSQIQTIGFPVTITARDSFGGLVSDYSGLVQLSSITTNVVATNLDFEQSTLAPWTYFNYTGYPDKPYQQTLYDVAGFGKLSTAFRTIAGGGSNGLVQNIYLAGGIPYTFKMNAAQSMEAYDMSCLGAGIYLQVGPTNTSWGTDICGGTARQTLTLTYTPPTNGVYPLQLTVYRDYYYNDALAVYLDDVQISYPVITPTVLTNNFTNGVWSGMVAALQPTSKVTLAVTDTEGHKGFSNPFDVQALADLGLTVTSQIQGTPPLRTGMRMQFNLAITNRGPSGVSNAVVHSQIASNLFLIATTNVQGTISNFTGGLDWTLPTLPKSSNFTAVLVYRADVAGDFTNQFSVLSPTLDLNTVDNFIAVSNHIDPPLLVISDTNGTEAVASTNGMMFKLTLSGPSAQTIAVDYLTVDGTASNGLDYVGTNGTVIFAPGLTNASVIVYAKDDILDEPDRSFSVLLTNAVNAIISDGLGIGTVVDDDPPPTISIADTSVVEGDSGTTNAVFQLTLNKPAIVDVSVRCATATNTASTSDFISTVTTVIFPAGKTNTTFTVPVNGNTVNEPDETFFVNLSLPANATIARAQAVGTILNDDAVPGRLDHFVWDAIPLSPPHYRDLAFPVTLRAVDYLGNPASNGVSSATVTARTENGFASWMQDDFEDGDSVGWTNFNSSFTAVVTNDTAAQGADSLRLTGSTASTTAGWRRSFSNALPNRISFSVRVGRTNQVAGRLTAYASGLYRSAVFYFSNNGQMGLLDAQRSFHGVPYQSNHWYQVDLFFNWGAQRVDCRIDGAPAFTNITFPESVTAMDSVVLANQDNTTSWWDDIRVYNDNLTNVFTITPSNFNAFAKGVKSNSVIVSGTSSNVFLSADDGLEHVGKSGLFDLLQAKLTLLTPASLTEGTTSIVAQVKIPVAYPQALTVNLTSTAPARLTMPASVIIPPNQTNAGFSLGVVDDTNADWTKSILISATGTNLDATTNTLILIDNDPAMSIGQYGKLADGTFQMTLQGPPTQNYVLFASSNLINWNAISNISFSNGPVMIIDPASTNFDHRYYRLTPAP